MTRYIFDAEPLLAYLYDEPGADTVEVIYKVARLETGRPDQIEPGEAELTIRKRDLRVFQGFGLGIETPSWGSVARIKASGGISLGDSYGVALAHERAGTLVAGGDPEFDDLPVDVRIDRIDAESG